MTFDAYHLAGAVLVTAGLVWLAVGYFHTDAGYRHGYGDGYAKASDDAKGHVRGHMHVVAGGEPS